MPGQTAVSSTIADQEAVQIRKCAAESIDTRSLYVLINSLHELSASAIQRPCFCACYFDMPDVSLGPETCRGLE